MLCRGVSDVGLLRDKPGYRFGSSDRPCFAYVTYYARLRYKSSVTNQSQAGGRRRRPPYSWLGAEVPQVLFLVGCEGRGWLARGV